MQLIMISGRAGVGKTTLAKMVAEEAFNLGLLPKLLSFAGPLKKMAKERGYDKEQEPSKYREFCQSYASMKREEDPDFWVNQFESELLDILKLEKMDLKAKKKYWERCIIADDCRYMNEIGMGMKYRANLIFLSYGTRDVPNPKDTWRNHHSENLAQLVEGGDKEYIEIFTHVVINDKKPVNLKNAAKDMTPLWCGVRLPETNGCNCEACTSRREGRPHNKERCISDLIDLLLLGRIEEEEQEDDEDTE